MMLKHPHFLWLLLILIPLIVWHILKFKNSNASLGLSSLESLSKYRSVGKVWLMHFAFALQLLAISAIIVALCRPQERDALSKSTVEGTDIVIALDISSSMLAEDLQPNRIQSAKEVASKFINQRDNDNIGLVIFSGESLSVMPLTTDKAALINALNETRAGSLNDGTAIGDGLASAINRLVSGQAKSKSIILLTDGTNNAGEVAPSTAAQIARQKGIRVYAIGVGTNGSIKITNPYGFSSTTMETKIDEDALKEIASITQGKYFRATDSRTLRNVFDEIDSLEKTKIDINNYNRTKEVYMNWMLIALCALSLQLIIRYTALRRIP